MILLIMKRKSLFIILQVIVLICLTCCNSNKSEKVYKKPDVTFAVDASTFSEHPYFPDGTESGLPEESEESTFIGIAERNLSLYTSFTNLLRPYMSDTSMREGGYLSLDEFREADWGQYLRYIDGTPWAYTIDPLKGGGYLICLFTITEKQNGTGFYFRMIDSLSFYGFDDERILTDFKIGDPYLELVKANPRGYYWYGYSLHFLEDGRILKVLGELNYGSSQMTISAMDIIEEKDLFTVLYLISDADYNTLCSSVMKEEVVNSDWEALVEKLEGSTQESQADKDTPHDPFMYSSNIYIPEENEADLPAESERLSFLKQDAVDFNMGSYDAVNWCISPISTGFEQRFTLQTLMNTGLGRYINYIEGTPWCISIDKLKDDKYLLCLFIISEREEGKRFTVIDSMIFAGFPDKEKFASLKTGDDRRVVEEADPDAYYDDIVSVHRFADGTMLEIRYTEEEKGEQVIEFIQERNDGYADISVLDYLTDEEFENVTGENKRF